MALLRQDIPATSVTGTAGSEQTLITAPANGDTRLVRLSVNNHSAGAETLTINLVPDGGSVATTNEIITDASVGVGVNSVILQDLVIAKGATLELAASTTARLVVYGWYQVIV